MEHMAYCIRILCGLCLPNGFAEAGAWGYYLIHAGVYIAVYQVFAKKMIQNGSLTATAQDSLTLTLVTLAVVVGMRAAPTAKADQI